MNVSSHDSYFNRKTTMTKKQCKAKSINTREYISSTKYRNRSDDMRTLGLERHCSLLGNGGIFPEGKMWIGTERYVCELMNVHSKKRCLFKKETDI